MSLGILIQPDPELSTLAETALRAALPQMDWKVIPTGAGVVELAEATAEIDWIVTEIYLEDMDGMALFDYLRAKYPQAHCVIATKYDLSAYAAQLQGLPQAVLPHEIDKLSAALSPAPTEALGRATRELGGLTLGTFKLGAVVEKGPLGTLFEAEDLNVHRPVYLTVLPGDTDPETVALFHKEAAAKAKASHPNVTAVYQAGEAGGRHFFSSELWKAPSVAETVASGKTLDARAVARILGVLTQVLSHWDKRQFHYPALTPDLITLGMNNVVKVQNCVTTLATNEMGAVDCLAGLVPVLRQLLPAGQPAPAPLQNLLQSLAARSLDLAGATQQAAQVEVALAPKKQMVASKEKIVAEKEITKTRSRQLKFILSAAGGLVSALLLLGFFMWQRLNMNMTEYDTMLKIPAGEFTVKEGETATTGEFWMDEYEVTIGQYLRFLKAAKGEPEKWLPDEAKGKQMTLEPYEWAGMIKTIKARQTWEGQPISLDFPVFNVNWYQAMAYAKWAGKRLPTEIEWQKAAALDKDGKTVRKYPWGNEFDPKKANLGQDYAPGDPSKGGKVDGFNGPNAVTAMGDDVSDFKVRGLAGNVAEWTATQAERLGMKVPVIKGAGFASQKYPEKSAAAENRITEKPPEFQGRWLGFRCVSDKPPAPKAK